MLNKLKITLPRQHTEKITITHRNLDRIDLDNFKLYLTAKLNTIRKSDNLQELYNEYMQEIESTPEIPAPEVNKITKKRKKTWFDCKAQQLNSKRRAAGKKGSKTTHVQKEKY